MSKLRSRISILRMKGQDVDYLEQIHDPDELAERIAEEEMDVAIQEDLISQIEDIEDITGEDLERLTTEKGEPKQDDLQLDADRLEDELEQMSARILMDLKETTLQDLEEIDDELQTKIRPDDRIGTGVPGLDRIIKGGLPIAQALEVSGSIIGNRVYQQVISESKERVSKGESVTSVFSRYPDIFTPLFCQMSLVGEKTGQLEKTLMNVANFYEEEINRTTENLVSIIEPVLILILGGMAKECKSVY